MTNLFDQMPREDWWANCRDNRSNRFSPLDQIDAGNFEQLELKWTWELPTQGADVRIHERPNKQFGPNEGTPLKVGNYLYTVTAASQVAKFDLTTGAPAVDAAGEPIIHDPKIYERHSMSMIGFLHRGAAYWQDDAGERRRIFLTRGDGVLVALDADSLKPVKNWGSNGRVYLFKHGPRSDEDPLRFGNTSPPIVCRHRIIVGSSMPDLNDAPNPPAGWVRAYDARTGRQLWRFDTIPSNRAMEDLGIDPETQWANDSNRTSGHANVWTHMSADEALDFVYLPTGSAHNDAYGGNRIGDNIYSQSLVALNATNGKVAWHQQLVHHGVWDYDLPAAPNLIDVTEADGKVTPLVAQVTKQAFVYVFDRRDGSPRWDLRECAVPGSSVPGEQMSPTQPVPVKPLPFDEQGVYPDDGYDLLQRKVKANVLNLTPTLRSITMNILSRYQYGPLYTPPVLQDLDGVRGNLQVPGFLGGASWAGAVADESTGKLYVSSVTNEHVNAVAPNNGSYFSAGSASWSLKDPDGRSHSLPILNPPWGRITAIDLRSGDHTWPKPAPVGRGPREMVETLAQGALPDGDLGWNRRTHLLITPNLLIAAQESGRGFAGFTDSNKHTIAFAFIPESPSERTLNAYAPDTGELISRVCVPEHAQGALMSFEHDGKQYIAIPTGGFNLPHRIRIYGLKE